MTCYTRPNEGRSDLLYSNYYEGRGRGEGGSRGNRIAMPRKGEHFSALREESARQVPPNASEDEVVLAPARTPRTTPDHRGLSLQQQQQRPVDKTNVPRLSRLAMRNPAPHPAPSAPHPTLVNGTTSRPSRPATALVACETVGRPEGFRLGHHFEKHTKKLRVSQWAETTVACVYDPR